MAPGALPGRRAADYTSDDFPPLESTGIPYFSGTHGQPPVASPIRVIPRIPYLLEVVKTSIDWDLRINFDMFKGAIEAAVPIALERGAEHVRGVAVSRTPNRTGGLAGSAGVTVHGSGIDCVADVKYPGPFAAFQNRGRRWDGSHIIRKRPAGGQTGFLTDTMVDQREAVLQIIADTIAQLS